MNQSKRDGVTYEIKERIGVVHRNQSGWTKEVNIISWNGGVPKVDIRDWNETHDKCSRGITLHESEMRILVECLNKYLKDMGCGSQEGKAVKEKASPIADSEVSRS